VEVDSSYYAMPKPEVTQLWAERTPPTFTFNIKAFRLFTGHQTSAAALPKDVAEALGPVHKMNVYYKDLPRELTDEMWRQYREAIEPLNRSGKLAAVHFQFAPWVAYHPKSRDHIEECQRQLEGDQLAIEFRNETWFEDKHAGGDTGVRARPQPRQCDRGRATGDVQHDPIRLGGDQSRTGNRSPAWPQSRDLEQ